MLYAARDVFSREGSCTPWRPPLEARKRDAFVNLKVQSAQPMLISHRPPLWGGLCHRGQHFILTQKYRIGELLRSRSSGAYTLGIAARIVPLRQGDEPAGRRGYDNHRLRLNTNDHKLTTNCHK